MNPDNAPANHQWIRLAVQQYERPLIRYATRITGNLAQGQEIVQEAFLRLCRQGDEVAEPKVKAWLYTVCRNHAIDRQRKETGMTQIQNSSLDHTANATLGPSVPVEQADTHSHVLAQIGQLPAKQQEVLCLKFQDDLSYKQIAQVTGLTVGHVGYLIHTGLKNLKQRLADVID